ncbi:MAG: superoxide dismutase [Fe] [Novosphingobium sp. 16-62-11]|uniref:superoxide dismutase n=1 Tax=Novosphingobium sp. 17-62-19 TaxID=1970406 RepID=UPI000BC8CCB4|nr:superoxide dismutase [Novosphingobium sp. 17-62-19]OYZ46864.1 MAG: superoxide dismutase [Fe] [Novosphingobium sp. 16-62-11]OZA18990.1 MAG: superoxide dismutase [Fe] [Novosphingobium sp. 17-62-19]OZA67225.1 MAG: superoxide dismutase [Fe] [Sphingomonadales bacterium 39-62-4]HQS97316.1 superoxide dismutase [Novosphingobium sp.]
MAIILPPLPYADTALEPTISATTLQTHHGKHHKAYVDKTNAAVEGTDLADASLEEIITAAEAKGDKGLFNNSAQSWNHAFYWNSMTAETSAPEGELATAIDSAFGSLEKLQEELASQGAAHFASGWVWLVSKGGKLAVEQTHDAATFGTGDAKPLLVIDLWEHAYYLDHKNLRPAYLKAVIEKHLNWAFAAENLARDGSWTYPG